MWTSWATGYEVGFRGTQPNLRHLGRGRGKIRGLLSCSLSIRLIPPYKDQKAGAQRGPIALLNQSVDRTLHITAGDFVVTWLHLADAPGEPSFCLEKCVFCVMLWLDSAHEPILRSRATKGLSLMHPIKENYCG